MVQQDGSKKQLTFFFQDVDVKWVEYQNMVNYLSQWIKHNVTVMSDRNFPCNPVELKVYPAATNPQTAYLKKIIIRLIIEKASLQSVLCKGDCRMLRGIALGLRECLNYKE